MQKLIYVAILSAAVCLVLAPIVIPMLRRLKFGQTERECGPQTHLSKSGTPTMGGIMIIAGIVIGTLVVAQYSTNFALPAMLCMLAYGLIGFLDDFIKVKLKRSLGLKAYQKIIGQVGIAAIVAWYAYTNPYIGSKVYFALFQKEIDFGIFYIPLVMFMVVAVTNSVNLTDGLDGLASGVSIVYSVAMAFIFVYMATAAGQAGQVEYAASLEGMSIFAIAVAGSCLGFMNCNAYPAKVFMGDTGSMALGGALVMMAIVSKALFLFLLMGICFVASAVSVILQVGSFKLRHGKRIFKMAPLHHHFELMGYSETKIVAMYMIITTLLCLLCLLAYQ